MVKEFLFVVYIKRNQWALFRAVSIKIYAISRVSGMMDQVKKQGGLSGLVTSRNIVRRGLAANQKYFINKGAPWYKVMLPQVLLEWVLDCLGIAWVLPGDGHAAVEFL